MKASANDLKIGLDVFKAAFDKNFQYSNVVTLTFDHNKPEIGIALEYIRMTSGNSSVYTVDEDHTKNTITVSFSNLAVSKSLQMYSELSGMKVFDGRRTVKEIICKDTEYAKEIMAVILVLCNFGLYGGYSYDYKTKRLTIF